MSHDSWVKVKKFDLWVNSSQVLDSTWVDSNLTLTISTTITIKNKASNKTFIISYIKLQSAAALEKLLWIKFIDNLKIFIHENIIKNFICIKVLWFSFKK